MGAVNSVMTFFGFGSAEPQKVEASAKPRPAASRPRRGSEMSEIITLEQGVPVIVNIGGMSEADSKRMLDFMLGLKEALEGQIRRVTPKVFLLSPSHVEVNDGEPEATDADKINRAYLLALSREPTAAERENLIAFLKKLRKETPEANPTEQLCRVILNLHETITRF